VARNRPDPAEWARISDEELAARAAEERERLARTDSGAAREQGNAQQPTGPTRDLSQRTHVTGRRLVAHLLDTLALGVITALLIGLGTLTDSNALLAIDIIAILFVAPVAYFVLTQRHAGQSPGKRIVGIKVIDEEGGVPTDGALVRRSIPLLFEWFWMVALASMIASPHRQRLGDRWAKTYVVDA
jgi:uncharacterized RDD family membrane protein YckC